MTFVDDISNSTDKRILCPLSGLFGEAISFSTNRTTDLNRSVGDG